MGTEISLTGTVTFDADDGLYYCEIHEIGQMTADKERRTIYAAAVSLAVGYFEVMRKHRPESFNKKLTAFGVDLAQLNPATQLPDITLRLTLDTHAVSNHPAAEFTLPLSIGP